MSFINWIMLGGMGALSIPLVIHLFNRSRFRVVEWGAMHLLANVVRVNKKRVKLEQLILLLIRCAIPAVLALLMARPVLTGWRALAGDVPASTVVLLDNSYSMAAQGASRTHFDVAVDETAAILSQLKRGSDVSVVLMGGGAEPIFDRPVFDTRGMVDQLRLQQPGYGPADTIGAITAGSTLLADMTHAKRDLILVSDFQQANWADVQAPERRRLSELLTAMNVPASLTFLRVGQPITENVAVESLSLSHAGSGGGGGADASSQSGVTGGGMLGVGQTLTVRANIRNFGKQTREHVRVYCRVDGQEHAASQVSLAGGETGQVLFTVRFDEPGSHLIQVEIDTPDLQADNTYLAAVPVVGHIPVLLVNGAPGSEPLDGETDFLEIALQPYAAARESGKLADLIETTTVNWKDLDPARLADYRAIVLANVPRLNDEQLAGVKRFVEQGGGLAVFSGNRIDPAWYNDTFADPGTGLLPMRLGKLADAGDDKAGHTAIVAQHYDHPALSMFNNRANGDLSDAVIRTWYKLESTTGGALDAPGQPSVVARLDTGDPLLIEHRLGAGAVMQLAVAADADWSNLPMRPFYLPLMQQLVTHLATTIEPPRNVAVNKPLVAVLPETHVGQRFTLVDPDGSRITLKATARNGRAVVEYANTRRPGLYLLTMPSGEAMHFVVHTARRESDLAQVTESQLSEIGESMQASVVGSAQEYLAMDAERRHGREIWKPLLLVLLVLIFAELFFQQRFAKGRGA